MSRAVRWIAIAAATLFAVGVIVAITQPGDLGDDDEGVALSTSTTQPGAPETTTTTPTTPPTTGPATTAPPTGGDGSGLGTGGAGTAQPGELVNSGHESLVLPGLVLAGLGALAGRRRRTR